MEALRCATYRGSILSVRITRKRRVVIDVAQKFDVVASRRISEQRRIHHSRRFWKKVRTAPAKSAPRTAVVGNVASTVYAMHTQEETLRG
jgi:hypothetical protein